MKRVIINFHGLGTLPAHVDAGVFAVVALLVSLLCWAARPNIFGAYSASSTIAGTTNLPFSDYVSREAATHVLVLGGLVLVLFASPPTRWFAVVAASVLVSRMLKWRLRSVPEPSSPTPRLRTGAAPLWSRSG